MEGIRLENIENLEKIEKLKSYLSQGYLLHGSKRKLEVLEPRQATDENNRPAGTLLGVYAAREIQIPVVMALFDKKDPLKKSSRWSYSRRDDGPLVIQGENNLFTPGFVHVLPPETFEDIKGDFNGNEDREIVSMVAVKPVDIIEIDPSILNDLDAIELGEFKD